MATAPRRAASPKKIDYPTGDGKPMAETPLHRRVMADLIDTLEDRFAADPGAYVSGNMMMYYEEGNKRKHLSPDVFVAFGIGKGPRDAYFTWEAGKGPDVVIEITSKTTRREDQTKKLGLYCDVLRVPEYYQFDPTEDYLRPPFQGFRLVAGAYEPIAPVAGRLPSAALGLHLERDGTQLRLYDPTAGHWLPTPREQAAAAEAARGRAEAARDQAEAESERLRRELEELKRRLAGGA